MKIEKLTKVSVKLLRPALQEAMKTFEEATGMKAKVGIINYTPTDFKVSISACIQNADGSFETAERSDFKKMAFSYGLKPSDLDQDFFFNGEDYIIQGLKSRSYKYPIIAKKKSSGKNFKFPATLVKACLNSKR